SEYLQHDLSAHAADRFFDVVFDRSRKIEADARYFGVRLPHFFVETIPGHAGPPAVAWCHVAERLAHVHALFVGAVLGAALLAELFQHFGKFQQASADLGEDFDAAIDGDARRHLDENHDVAFVELREKFAAKMTGGEAGRDHQRRHACEHPEPVAEQPREQTFVAVADRTENLWISHTRVS